jgi:hypothetical protein
MMIDLLQMSVKMQSTMDLSRRGGFMSLEHFVLQRGAVMAPPTVKAPREIRGPRRECFRNAALAAHEGEYIYCEGYATTWECSPVPIFHAWLVDLRGRTIDPTWDMGGSEYIGVPFLPGYLRKRLRAQEYYGLIDNPEQKFPVLRAHLREYLHPIVETLKARNVIRSAHETLEQKAS